jgi:hypothetical protein
MSVPRHNEPTVHRTGATHIIYGLLADSRWHTELTVHRTGATFTLDFLAS